MKILNVWANNQLQWRKSRAFESYESIAKVCGSSIISRLPCNLPRTSRFSPLLTGFFQGQHNFGDQDGGFSWFLSRISILIFDAEQLYWKIQGTNLKIKEVISKSGP